MEIRKIISGIILTIMLVGCTPVEPKQVVCAGDSITCGYLLPVEENYPSVLQELLGDSYEVTDSANVGLTAYDYLKMWYLKEAIKLDPDIVVIMFGSNDSNPSFFQSNEIFESYYTELIDSFKDSKVYICTPCKAYSKGYGVDSKNLESIVQSIQKIGKEKEIEVIDIYSLSSDHEEWFEVDGIHPNAEGAKAIAQKVYEAIKE